MMLENFIGEIYVIYHRNTNFLYMPVIKNYLFGYVA